MTDTDLTRRLKAKGRVAARARDRQRATASELNAEVVQAAAAGLSYRQIAAASQLSFQRVAQIVNRAEEER
jgi:hypothetical protein